MSTSKGPDVNDPKYLFETLTEKLRGKPEQTITINSHISELTNHECVDIIALFMSEHKSKLEILKECLIAVLRDDFKALKGTVPKGQAVESKPEESKKPANAKNRDQLADKMASSCTPKPAQAVATAVSAATTANGMGLTASPAVAAAPAPEMANITLAITQALAPFMQRGPGVNHEEVAVMVKQICASEMLMATKEMKGHFEKVLKAAIDMLPPKDIVEIRKWDGTVKELGGLRHKQLGLVIKAATARTSSGFPVNCYWWGAPAAGKTHMGGSLAEALGLPYYPIPLGPTSTEGKLLGYKNLATGAFVEGLLYKPFKNGGVTLLDEVDVADPSVLVGCNSLMSNGKFMFPNGEVVERHKDFFLIASANTLGTGATNGFTRNKLDAATLDRWFKIKMEYDQDLEYALAGNKPWVDYVHKVRDYVGKNCNNSIWITPRASINGSALLANGVPEEQVLEGTLFSHCNAEVRKTIIAAVGNFKP